MRKRSLVECGKLELRLSCSQIFLLPRLERDEGSPHPKGGVEGIEGKFSRNLRVEDESNVQ